MSVRRRAERSWAEWVTLALSVAVIGMLLAVALREESRVLGNDETYIEVTFDPVRATKRDGAHYVPYTVTNTGAVAIESAEIWLEVHDQGELVESAEVLVQFLPISGAQHGIFVTAVDPDGHEFRSRLESLQFP